MPEAPSLVEIALRKGYVTVISGEPGTGKTFFCLKVASEAAKRGEEVVYYTFNESSAELKSVLGRIFRFEGIIPIRDGLSLAPNGMKALIAEVMDELSKGKTVVLDSLEALIYSIPQGQEYRAILQMLYRSTRSSNGRLIVTSENPDPHSAVGYTADAFITFHNEIFMDFQYRYAYVKKARGVQLDYPLIPFSLFNGFTEIGPEGGGILALPECEKVLVPGSRCIIEFDSSVSPYFINLRRRGDAALLLKHGYGVVYVACPEEVEDEVINEVMGRVSDPLLMKNFAVLKIGGRLEDFDLGEFLIKREEAAKGVAGKPIISLMSLLCHNSVYRKVENLYLHLMLAASRRDREEGIISIGYTIEGLPVNDVEKVISDEYFLVKRRYRRTFIIRTKRAPAMFAPPRREEGLPFHLIPIY